MKVAVLGLGEAGSIYSTGFLNAGWEVRGYDPGDVTTPADVIRFTDIGDAVRGVQLVISLTSARVAERAARDAVPHLAEGAVYADMNSASAAVKSAVAGVVAAASGVLFADVAVLGSVPANGPRASLVISGPGSAKAAELFTGIGAPVDDIGGQAGDAAQRKLLRSSFMKGLGALIVEATDASIAAGAEQWLRDQIAAEITGGYAALDRLNDGTRKHAARRSVEAAASAEMLEELGIPAVLGRAVTEVHQRLADESRSSDELPADESSRGAAILTDRSAS